MDTTEAQNVLTREIEALRRLEYEDLLTRAPKTISERKILGVTLARTVRGGDTHRDVTAASGTIYQVETGVFFDDQEPGDLRVMVCVDGGDVSAHRPICDDFIKAPDGTFIDE